MTEILSVKLTVALFLHTNGAYLFSFPVFSL